MKSSNTQKIIWTAILENKKEILNLICASWNNIQITNIVRSWRILYFPQK